MSKRVKSINFFETTAKSIAVIAGNTVIKDVVIVQSGIDKVGDYMDNTFIDGIVGQGNEASTGIKCRGGHPNMCKDSLGTYIGDFHNFRAIEQDGQYKAVADLYIAEIAKKTMIDGKGISYHDYVVDMAKSHPDKFGNSIVFMASEEWIEMEGKEVPKLILEKLIASDIVDSPAATDGLFKSDDDLGVKLTEFLDDNPELFTALEKNEDSLGIFFRKYAHHLSSKGKNLNMTIKEKMAAWLKGEKPDDKKQKNIDVTAGDGTILTVITDANEPKVGDDVQIGDAPAPDGDYVMTDGSTWKISAGKIVEIVPAAQGNSAEEGGCTCGQNAKEISALKAQVKSLEGKLTATQKSNTTATQKQKELEDAFEELCKNLGSEYVPKNPGAEGKGAKGTEESTFTITKKKTTK